MSYLALARKWRPTKFSDVVGQSHVVTALANALKQNRLHHAYLFSGTRGVGKTSIGRLFAKGLNCETGITDTPCGTCATCQEIDQGRHVDLLEIDAASRTKVEDTREILDNVQYKPARGRFKIYLIDEVHMLSRHSFNALLKTLEEPPEYVKFLLATTDPQKLPVTILSRCLQFHLKPIQADEIHTQLAYVLDAEQVSYENRALGLIAHAADGSMRDALSLSDQAIALGNAHLDSATVANMLGTLDTEQALDLLEALQENKTQFVFDTLNQLASQGIDWDGLLKELVAQIHRIAMYQALPASLDKTKPDAERIRLLAASLSPEQIQLYYQICLKGRDDLPLAPNGKMALEMLMLRLLAFAPKVQQTVQSIPQANLAPAPQAAPRANPAPMQQQQTINRPTPSQSPPKQVAPPPAHDRQQRTAPQAPIQQAQQSVPEQVAPQQAPQQAPASPISGLRHQLRSRKQQVPVQQSAQSEQPNQAAPQAASSSASAASTQGAPVKKTTATPSSQSMLERVAMRAKHVKLDQSPISSNGTPMSGAGDGLNKDSAYRWQPTAPVKEPVQTSLTPSVLKKSLEHEKTQAMNEQLTREVCEQNPWAAMIAKFETEKLIEQLALNSTFKAEGEQVYLGLRAAQQHLNTPRAQEILAQALSAQLGHACTLHIEISEEGETPLEQRERLYQEKLQQAFESLQTDPNIVFMQQRFSAQLDAESVRPRANGEDELKSF